MDSVTRVQILEEAVYHLHRANTLWKGMNLTILPSAMYELWEKSGLFNLGMATSLEERKLWITTKGDLFMLVKLFRVISPSFAKKEYFKSMVQSSMFATTPQRLHRVGWGCV